MQRICAVKERLGQYYATRIGAVEERLGRHYATRIGAVEDGLNGIMRRVLTLWVGILQRVLALASNERNEEGHQCFR